MTTRASNERLDIDSSVPDGSLPIATKQSAIGYAWTAVEALVTGLPTDGVTDATATIQAAIDAANSAGGGTVRLPAGTFVVSALTMRSNVTLFGAGRTATTLKSSTGNVINISGNFWSIRSLTLLATATGGHLVAQTAGVDRSVIRDVRLTQQNPAKSIWASGGFGYVDMLVENFDQSTAAAQSVPGWNMAGGGGDVNVNTWRKGRHTGGAGATAYAFVLDSQSGGAYYYDNRLSEINFETTYGGGVWLGGAMNFVLDQLMLWDSASITADFLSVGQGTVGSLISRVGSIRSCGQRASTYGASVYGCTIRTSGCSHVHFESCTGTSSGAPFPINLNNLTTMTLRPGVWYSITNGAPAILSDAIAPGSSVTGSRPAANGVPVGSMWYDTTLGKPIWSNGTAWRDAAGTAV